MALQRVNDDFEFLLKIIYVHPSMCLNTNIYSFIYKLVQVRAFVCSCIYSYLNVYFSLPCISQIDEPCNSIFLEIQTRKIEQKQKYGRS